MDILIKIFVFIIALEHLGFLYLEMFLWSKPAGRKIFGNTKETAETTKVLAANQGLYNGFLAAGLFWGLLHPEPKLASQIILFFLCCIVVAGVYGGLTAKRSILYVQALPAFVTILLLVLN